MTTDVFEPEQTIVEDTPVVVDPVIQKRLTDKDSFIERLKSEQAELRAELAKRLDAETELQKIRSELQQLREQPAPKDNTSPALDAANIQKLVLDTITNQEQSRTKADNVTQANSDMVKFYGTLEKAAEQVKTRSVELGMTLADLRGIAERSPTAFSRLIVGDVKPAVVTSPMRSTVNPAAGPVSGTFKFGSKAYFDNLRETNPKEYFKPSTQNAIIKAADEGLYFEAS